MAATVTNAQVDTAAGAVAAGAGGPLTRVSDVETFPTPNSEQNIELTTAVGATVYATYVELGLAGVIAAKIASAEGNSRRLHGVKTAINTLDTTMDAYALPHTYAEWKASIRSIRAIAQVRGLP